MSRSKIYYYLDNQSDYTNVTEHFNNPTPDTVYNSISGMAPASDLMSAPVFAPASDLMSAPVFAPRPPSQVFAPRPPPILREWYLNKLILKGKNNEKYWTVEVN